MNEPERPIISVLGDALEYVSPAERAAFLERACAGDPARRERVEALLRAHEAAGIFLQGDPPPAEAATTDEAPRERPGAVIGPYKLLEQIGEGGFGVVFMAEQQEPVRRKVALKVLKPGMDTKQVVARFEAERQALALMDHPNIAHVFDGGEMASGRPYFVMELVKGVPITKYCDEHRLTPRQRLELFVPVCEAVQHAHQKGVIHRDLKPTNVMVALYDGKPVPKVIDFGVAKAAGQPLTDKTLFTGFGALVGTLEYMSPEQAELNQLDVDTRSDVYSLGVLLYELLTGTTPLGRRRLKDTGLLEALRIIREEETLRPSARLSTTAELPAVAASRGMEPKKLSGAVRGELDWIVMKALEKDRDRRYDSANAFAADLRRHLHDEPVVACPPSAWYRFRKLARRRRRALVMASVLVLAALVGIGALALSTVLVWQANKGLKGAVERERREAYFQRITLAHRELTTDAPAAGVRALRECPEDLRGWEWHYLMRLCNVEPLVLRDKAGVHGVAFSPDGELLASAGEDGAVRIRNSRTGKLVQVLPHAHDKAACSVAFHPGGKHLASAGADGLLKVWDLTTGQVVFNDRCDVINNEMAAYAVAFSPPDGRRLAAGSDGAVRVWDWGAGQLLYTFRGHERHSIPVAFSPDGQRLATASWREGPRLWDPITGDGPVRTFPGDGQPISALAFSPDGGRLASASFDRSVRVWDTTTGDVLTLPHAGNVLSVAFSPDGRRLASAGEDKTVHVWDAETGREVLALRGHTDVCGCVAFSPDGWRLASASTDGTIRIWDATPLQGNEGQGILTFTQHHHEVRSAAFSPDGRWIASAGLGTDVKVWDAATGHLSIEFDAETPVVFCLAWHPDGQRLASAGLEGEQFTIKVWDLRNQRVAFHLPAGPEYFAMAFSPDGHYLVAGRHNGDLESWDAETGHRVCTLGSHKHAIRGVVFSRDGRCLASASQDGEVKLWDAMRLNERQTPRQRIRARVPGPSVNVAFSSDGRRLATGGDHNTVKIWDVQDGQELRALRGHAGEVYALEFSPDHEGRWVASAGEDGAVKVWDSRTGELLRSFRGHTGVVCCVSFSPDGSRLASGSRDATVKLWDLTPLSEAPER
jgi:WD40 repeat protein/serine/threonine protein kinase